jgi:hypothetical protein
LKNQIIQKKFWEEVNQRSQAGEAKLANVTNENKLDIKISSDVLQGTKTHIIL